MRAFLSDVTYAARTFRKKPAFAITAIGTLALGIGSTAAIFSVVNAVLLTPLPYREPQRLVHVWHDLQNRNVRRFPWAPADFHDLRTQATLFEGVAALTTGRQVIVNEGFEGDAEQIRTGAMTPNLFQLLGARVVLGRDFTEADGIPLPPPPATPPPVQTPPPPPRVIVSYEFWQRRCGGNPSVVGTVISLGDQRVELVGVLEPGFEILFPPDVNIERAPDIWTPMRVNFAAGSRVNVAQRVIARLKPGVTIEQAQKEVDRLAADLRERFPIKKTAGFHLRLEPVHQDLVSSVKPVILALMGAVSFVMLIACANVANLLLVRAAAREKELAIRAALGGSRVRLIRQLLVESVLLAGIAAFAGVLLATFGVELLLAFGPDNLPRISHVRVDPNVVIFTAVAALASAVIFGLVPALRASRPDVMDLLRRAGRTSNLSSGTWLRNAVVVVEVALAFVLLVGSGLMIRSFIALQRAQPGYDPDRVLTFLIPNLRQPDDAARQAIVRELKTRFAALPGVTSVTAAAPLPLDPRESLARYGTEEALTDPSKFGQATLHIVQPGYFDALRTRIVEGRVMTEEDNKPGLRVMVIDRILAARAFPSQSAVGKTLLARINTAEAERFEIVGVVEHQRHRSLARDGREAMYISEGYMGFGAANRWAIRTSGDPMSLASAVRSTVAAVDRRVGVIDVQPMLAFVERAQAQTKFALVLIGVFAVIALVLAGVGLYSVLSTTVRQRTAEIGVRMAFGAEHRRIFQMMVVQGLKLSTAGLACGVCAALALTSVIQSMLVGVEATDPVTYGSMAVGFLLIAAVACGVPAFRAARLDPMVALRDE
ncbi:MAG TPA: ABC transporter permease [Vicinamibacterales bacterium]|jgi:putative ABC transport system permease protein